uniref:Uncharacterized protein n=1 Tax=Timema poppense TaxID=170557 RepID=A0A7R9GUI6_TIMPO|nr:unnamed protein product [Timema poppensis]
MTVTQVKEAISSPPEAESTSNNGATEVDTCTVMYSCMEPGSRVRRLLDIGGRLLFRGLACNCRPVRQKRGLTTQRTNSPNLLPPIPLA